MYDHGFEMEPVMTENREKQEYWRARTEGGKVLGPEIPVEEAKKLLRQGSNGE